MATIVLDCFRCGAKKATHDCYASTWVDRRYNWCNIAEVYVVCRECKTSSIAVVSQQTSDGAVAKVFIEQNGLAIGDISLNDIAEFERFISKLDKASREVPEHLPENLHEVFAEGNKCLSASCWNAAASMYRLVLDLKSKELLPKDKAEAPDAKTQRSLGLRLKWLFEKDLLPADLQKLAECVQQDGNDGTHDGTLTPEDAEDLYDFTYEFMRRLVTEPKRIELAEGRRKSRRNTQQP